MLTCFLAETERDQGGEIPVLVAGLLDQCVERIADVLPDRITVGSNDHRPRDRRVVRQLGFADDVVVPAGKIHRLFTDVFDEPCLLLLLDRHVASEYTAELYAGSGHGSSSHLYLAVRAASRRWRPFVFVVIAFLYGAGGV